MTGCALTESERMFEASLTSHGIISWTHPEKAPSGKLVSVSPGESERRAIVGINHRLTMLGAMLGKPGFQFQLGVRPSDENPI